MKRSRDPDVLDLRGAAALLKLHPTTVSRLARQHGLGRRIGRVYRFSRRLLLAHIEGADPAGGLVVVLPRSFTGDSAAPLSVRLAAGQLAAGAAASAREGGRITALRVVAVLLAMFVGRRQAQYEPAVELLAEIMRALHDAERDGPHSVPQLQPLQQSGGTAATVRRYPRRRGRA